MSVERGLKSVFAPNGGSHTLFSNKHSCIATKVSTYINTPIISQFVQFLNTLYSHALSRNIQDNVETFQLLTGSLQFIITK